MMMDLEHDSWNVKKENWRFGCDQMNYLIDRVDLKNWEEQDEILKLIESSAIGKLIFSVERKVTCWLLESGKDDGLSVNCGE